MRNGETIARMAASPTAVQATVRDLLAQLRAERADAGLADDLESVQAAQPALPRDPWPTWWPT